MNSCTFGYLPSHAHTPHICYFLYAKCGTPFNAECSHPEHTMTCVVTKENFAKSSKYQKHFVMERQESVNIRYYFGQITNYTIQGEHLCIVSHLTLHIAQVPQVTLQITQVTLHGGGHIGNQRKARAGRVLHRSPATKSNPAPPPLISTTRLTLNHPPSSFPPFSTSPTSPSSPSSASFRSSP